MEVKASSSAREPIGFFHLPLEIRRQIYQHSLVFELPIKVDQPDLPWDSWNWLNMAPLLLTPGFASEASVVFHGDNVVQLDLNSAGERGFRRSTSIGRRRLIRKMQFVLSFHCCDVDDVLDFTFWSPLIAQLRKVSIVAQQPEESTDGSSIDSKMKRWTEWLQVILKFITSHVQSSCIIEVDDDGKKETSALMKEYLPSNHRNVQIYKGDFYRRSRPNYTAELYYAAELSYPANWRYRRDLRDFDDDDGNDEYLDDDDGNEEYLHDDGGNDEYLHEDDGNDEHLGDEG